MSIISTGYQISYVIGNIYMNLLMITMLAALGLHRGKWIVITEYIAAAGVSFLLCMLTLPSDFDVFSQLGLPAVTKGNVALYLILSQAVVGALFGLLTVKGNFLYQLSMTITFIAVRMELNELCSALTAVFFGNTFSVMHNLVFIAAMTLAFLFLCRFRLQTTVRVPAFSALSLMVVSALVVMYMILKSEVFIFGTYGAADILSLTALLLMSLGMYYGLYFQVHQEEDRYRLQQSLAAERIGRLQLDEAVSQLNGLRSFRHDIQNHMMIMQSLVDAGNLDELRRYFNELDSSHVWDSRTYVSGNSAVDAVLNRKVTEAHEKHITMVVSTALPESFHISSSDLCAVLFNLIDNAFEAVADQGDARVDVAVSKEKNYIIIRVRNPVQYDVLRDNPRLLTTKKDKAMHGIGLSVVRNTAEKYDGSCSFSAEDGYFTSLVMLKDLPTA